MFAVIAALVTPNVDLQEPVAIRPRKPKLQLPSVAATADAHCVQEIKCVSMRAYGELQEGELQELEVPAWGGQPLTDGSLACRRASRK